MFEFALLVTALLFGGATLYSFGFAAFVFTALPAETASPLIRRAFPHFYLFVFATSLVPAFVLLLIDLPSSAILGAIALTTIYARQILMPQINNAADAGRKQRFKTLHGFSVVITLIHIVAAAYVLVRLSGLS